VSSSTPRFFSSAQTASTSSTQMLSWNRDPESRSATLAGSTCSCAAEARRRLTKSWSNFTQTELSSAKTTSTSNTSW